MMNRLLRDGALDSGRGRSVAALRPGVPRSQSDSAALIHQDHGTSKVCLPFHHTTYLPFDFFSEKGVSLEHTTRVNVFYWRNRYSETINDMLMPEVTQEDLQEAFDVTSSTKKLVSDAARSFVRSRFIALCKEYYFEDTKHFTRFNQVVAFLNMEIAAGRGETVYKIIYERWPPSWECEYEEKFCKENLLVLRGWMEQNKQYKGFVSKIASSVIGAERRKFTLMVRRQKASVVNGKKIRRRHKHKQTFDPELHLKNSPKKERNNNGKRAM